MKLAAHIMTSLCLLLVNCMVAKEVSFFGNSYIHLPLQEAKTTTLIQFDFLTKRMNAILLLAAGKIDFCLVLLEGGEVKVKINTGSGEKQLSSPRSLLLSDLKWHKVNITRLQNDVTLTIDEIHVTRLNIPGRFNELNIEYGLFLAGIGTFRDLFLGHFEYYRGCMRNAFYNKIDVLSASEHASSEFRGVVHATGADCASEFGASSEQPIGFLGHGAFMSFRNPTAKNSFLLRLSMLTYQQTAVIFYATAASFRPEFVAVEIVNGNIRLSMAAGNHTVSVTSSSKVSDGRWHEVSVQCAYTQSEIIVDGTSVYADIFAKCANWIITTEHFLFLGGIEINLQSTAIHQKINTKSFGFKGCMRNVYFNNRIIGFQQAVVTSKLEVGCTERELCLPEVDCGKSPQARLEVDEGSFAYLSKSLIESVVPSRALNPLTFFQIADPPSHGYVEVSKHSSMQNHPNTSFTLVDVETKSVRYIHDGSEEFQDSFSVKMDKEIKFVTSVRINPINDGPILILPHKSEIHVPSRSAFIITSDLIKIFDPDSSKQDIKVNVLSHQSHHNGYFKWSDERHSSEQVITEFTQHDIEAQSVAYFHRGPPVATLALQATDGKALSSVTTLRIHEYYSLVRVANNTGLLLTHGSIGIITSDNLSLSIEGEEIKFASIHFIIVEQPKFGKLTRTKNFDTSSEVLLEITPNDIENGKIAYKHYGKNLSFGDDFIFRLRIDNVILLESYVFRIRFLPTVIDLIAFSSLVLEDVEQSVITKDNVLARTLPTASEEEDIYYLLTSAPNFGDLTLNEEMNKTDIVGKGGSFSQADVSQRRLRYKLKYPTRCQIVDKFTFKLKVAEWNSNEEYQLDVFYYPKNVWNLSPLLIDMLEGGMSIVTSANDDFFIPIEHPLVLNITKFPLHGWLHILESNPDNAKGRRNITCFTLEEFENGLLFYEHDDSESSLDVFQFSALYEEAGRSMLYVNEVHVRIVPKNDNPPFAVSSLILYVTTGGEKILSPDVMSFSDTDRDSRPADIQITREELTNGAFFLRSIDGDEAAQVEEVYHFTQADVNNGRVLFRHQGDKNGSCALWVTDGEFYVTAVLFIEASNPFVRISKSTGIIAPLGGTSLITSHNMTVMTNVNVSRRKIRFVVQRGPRHGMIRVGNKTAVQFSLMDLEESLVYYIHEGSQARSDEIFLKVEANVTSVDHLFHVKVYPRSYWIPLRLILNRDGNISVQENSRIKITSRYIQVGQIGVPAEDIAYFVKRHPVFGRLEFEPTVDFEPSEAKQAKVVTFTQSTIEEGRLFYAHEATPSSYEDCVLFDISNGITSVLDVALCFEIIPRTVPLVTDALLATEGGNVTIAESAFRVGSPHYAKQLKHFEVLQGPVHGRLAKFCSDGGNATLKAFSVSDLRAGGVTYCHDGSENRGDQLVVRAWSAGAWSAPTILSVDVLAVNNKAPVIVNNTGWEVWESSYLKVTRSMLGVYDVDTNADSIFYHVTKIVGGYFTISTHPSVAVETFSQWLINEGRISLVHSGITKSIRFRLFATDGTFNTSEAAVFVKVNEVRISLKNNRVLRLLPGAQAVISNEYLSATTNNPHLEPHHIRYIVRTRPAAGKLALLQEGSGAAAADTFLQSDVDAGNLSYTHDAHAHAGNMSSDFFIFDVESRPAAPLKGVKFKLTITKCEEVLDRLKRNLTLGPLFVREGGSVVVRASDLSMERVGAFVSVWSTSNFGSSAAVITLLRVTHFPQHGSIFLHNLRMEEPFGFTVEDVSANALRYQHDDSETVRDDLTLAVLAKKWESPKEEFLILEDQIYVYIEPVDDQEHVLMTRLSVIDVAPGGLVRLTSRELLTVDNDTSPKDLMYEIIGGPLEGFFTIVSKEEPAASSNVVTKFSQSSVNSGIIAYVHKGHAARNDSAYFRVTDGHHDPSYGKMYFVVSASSLAPNLSASLTLIQGSEIAVLTPAIFAPGSGKFPNHFFSLIKQPQHGAVRLYDNNHDGSNFTFEAIDEGNVKYVQTDKSAHQDVFVLASWGEHGRSNFSVTVTVSVQPLVLMRKELALVSSDRRVQISPDHLTADMLADSSESDPIFEIVKEPTYVDVCKLAGEQRSGRTVKVQKFSNSDVTNGLVFLSLKGVSAAHPLLDFFEYRLSAHAVQPAFGTFSFRIIPAVPNSQHPPLLSFSSSRKETDVRYGKEADAKAMTDSQSIAALVVDAAFISGITIAAAFIVILSAVVALRCIFMKKNDLGTDFVRPVERKDSPELRVYPNGDILDDKSDSPVSTLSTANCRLSTIDDLAGRPFPAYCTLSSSIFSSLPCGRQDKDYADNHSVKSEDTCESCQVHPLLHRNQYWV